MSDVRRKKNDDFNDDATTLGDTPSFLSKLLKVENLKIVQAVTGGFISSFYQAHLITIVGSHWGESSFNGLLELFRSVYQHPVFESVLVGSVLVHLGANSYLLYRQFRACEAAGGDPNDVEFYDRLPGSKHLPSPAGLHQIAGYFMSVGIFAHTSATRLPALWKTGYQLNYKSIYYTLRQWPLVFYPYYTALSSMMFYHYVFTGYRIFSKYVLGRQDYKKRELIAKRKWYGVFAMGVGISISSLLALGGRYYRVSSVGLPPPMSFIEYAKHIIY
eukprot:gene15936-18945_t